jgi:hypothetical protein
MHGMGVLPTQIYFEQVNFRPIFCLLFCSMPQYEKMFQIVLLCFYHVHVWNIFGCSNHSPIPFFDSLFLSLSATSLGAWIYDVLAKMQCLCSGAKNIICMRDRVPWSIPYAYMKDNGVVFWCTKLIL